jgi:hypothetical protein
MVIEGIKFTIGWHVDDLKAFHKNLKVLNNILLWLDKEFGELETLTINHGNTHEYLGMTLEFCDHKKLMISIENYIKDTLAELPNDLHRKAATLARFFYTCFK